MGEVVITPVKSGSPRLDRDLPERLMVRFPEAWRALVALGLRLLGPRSRLRRAGLRREMASAYAAANRRDFELMLVRYSPNIELDYDPDFEALGLGGTFRGHDGMVRFLQAWGEAWERWEVEPVAAVDLGDRLVGLGRVHLPANVSGLELDREFAQLITIRRGLGVREQEFMSWNKALLAAGLDPDALALPSRR